MLRTKRLLWLFVLAILVLLPLTSSSVSGEDGKTAIDMRSLKRPAREIRDVVPFGKDDASFGTITKAPEGIQFPPNTPIMVRLRLTKAPKLKEAIRAVLQVHAFEDAPGTVAEIELPEGAEVLEGSTRAEFDLAAHQRKELRATIVFNETGEHAIVGRAQKTVSAELVWGDMDAVYLTVDQDSGAVGWQSGRNPELASGQLSADAPNLEKELQVAEGLLDQEDLLLQEVVEEEAEEEDLEGLPEPEGDEAPPGVQESGDASLAYLYVDISICWTLGSDRDGTKPPLRDAYVRLYDQDSGADDILATGYLGYTSGCKTFRVYNRDTDECCTIDPYVAVYLTHSGRYRVHTYGGATFWAKTTTKWNVTANHSFGTWWVGGGSGNDRSVRIWNDLYRARRFVRDHAVLRGNGGYPGYVNVRWQTGGTSGTYYSLGEKQVHLKDEDAKSRDTVVHEAAHSYMHKIYGWSWPCSDCTDPHYINRRSGCCCGWSEGFTYVFVAAADGNPVYTWPSGATLDLENPWYGSANWDDGPKVEGRVGGALIDLMDKFRPPATGYWSATGFKDYPDEPRRGSYLDETSGFFGGIWDIVYDQNDDVFIKCDTKTNSFSNEWEARQYPRYAPHWAASLNSLYNFTHD
jgi:hypothetical protein